MIPKTPRVEYSPHKRSRIVTSYDLGLSARVVAFKEGVPANSVTGIVSRYRIQKSAQSSPRSGRLPIISNKDKKAIFRCIKKDPFTTAKQILEDTSLRCCKRTLLRYLYKHGIGHPKAVRRPFLTPEAAEARLVFAIENLNRPIEWWKYVFFSDESTVQRGQGERQKRVFCEKGTQLQKEHVQPRMKPTHHGQMFWGAFSYYNRSSLVPLLGDPDSKRGGVTARKILECYQENLPIILSPGSIFQEDNASTHTAKIVQDWLQEFALENGISLMLWPAYSPDLNPIENLWHILKTRINEQYPELAVLPKTDEVKQKLIEVAVAVWEGFEDSLLEKLIETMPARLQAVVDAKGWYTKW